MFGRWMKLASLTLLLPTIAPAQRAAQRLPIKEPSAAETLIQTHTAKAIIEELIAHERGSAEHRNMYTYLSYERSERTGNRLWTERVVESPEGHIRKLIAIDNNPLTPQEEGQERGRLAEVLKDPAAFRRHELDRQKDELRVRTMVQLLDKAFLFENMHVEGEDVRIESRPNPEFHPKTIEERVLQGMSGSVTIEPKAIRIRRIEAHLPQDLSIGFGIVATVRAGTNFSSERAPVESSEWKTRAIDTHVDGRSLFFKTLSKNEHAVHDHFERVPNNLTLEQAVARAEQ